MYLKWQWADVFHLELNTWTSMFELEVPQTFSGMVQNLVHGSSFAPYKRTSWWRFAINRYLILKDSTRLLIFRSRVIVYTWTVYLITREMQIKPFQLFTLWKIKFDKYFDIDSIDFLNLDDMNNEYKNCHIEYNI